MYTVDYTLHIFTVTEIEIPVEFQVGQPFGFDYT